MPKLLSVFLCSPDGRYKDMVAARSMAEAARLTGIPYTRFREYGSVTRNEVDCSIALASPGVVFEKECADHCHTWSVKGVSR